METSDIEGLRRQFERIQRFASATHSEVEKDYSKKILLHATLSPNIESRTEAIIEEYESAWIQFQDIRGDKSRLTLEHVSCPPYVDYHDSIKLLTKIEIECEKAIGFLEKMQLPKLTSEQIDKLGSLRQELEQIEETNFERNLSVAIDEYERGDWLASALISSRVVAYCLSKIPGKDDEEKVKFLVEKGIVGKDRKDEKKLIMKSSRFARNFLSHDIGNFPSPEEALSLLSESVRIAKLLAKLPT